MKFTLEINLDNVAFHVDGTRTPYWDEVNRMVHNLHMDLHGAIIKKDKGILRDSNGNTCGKWRVTH